VFTFFSPSSEALAERFPADVSAYLPWDLPEIMDKVLDAVCPGLVVFTQKEVWPSLASGAGDRGVPVAMVAATLTRTAGRLSPTGRVLLGSTFRGLECVAAISADDGGRFQLLEVPGDRIVVTGDPGVDYAHARAAAADPEAPYLRLFRDGLGPVLVAGSTWAPDEDVLIPALTRIRRDWPGLRVVLAPHEPREWDFENLRARLHADGWAPTLLKEAEERGGLDGADAVLVERVGVLAELYTVASFAYVGGGFHGHGLHSVLEPAAAGVPVLFGPQHHNSLAASHLLACGGARMVSDVDALTAALEEWLADPEKLRRDGRRALDYIAEHRGAAGRTADLLVGYFSDRA
jgi:3-deoxy-D-manno-octulosonic-acid transferase